jgi:hypothetical protein
VENKVFLLEYINDGVEDYDADTIPEKLNIETSHQISKINFFL